MGIVQPADLAQIDREFVEKDQGRLATEEFTQGFGAGCYTLLVAAAQALVAAPPGQRIGDFAPGRAGQNAVAHGTPVRRIGVLAVEGRNAHRPRRHQGRLDELRDIRNAFHAARHMGECDQSMSLAAAVRGIETKDRRRLATRPAKAPPDIGQQVLKPPGRIGPGEERQPDRDNGCPPAAPPPAPGPLQSPRRQRRPAAHPRADARSRISLERSSVVSCPLFLAVRFSPVSITLPSA